MIESEFMNFTQKFMKNFRESSTDESLHYIFIECRGLITFLTASEHYNELKNTCVWNKTTGGTWTLYRIRQELICVFKNGESPRINNIRFGSNNSL